MKAGIIIAAMAIGLWVTGLLVAPATMAVELDLISARLLPALLLMEEATAP
jgi:hypothetical protein